MRPAKSSKKRRPKTVQKKQTVRYRNLEHYALIERAAQQLDVSLNQFIKQSSVEAARRTLNVTV